MKDKDEISCHDIRLLIFYRWKKWNEASILIKLEKLIEKIQSIRKWNVEIQKLNNPIFMIDLIKTYLIIMNEKQKARES